ncbi:SLOG family protein [Streptosporangium sp. NPDC049078]|uniref:SLOG family protein n=1 Tax=Streptosporangium sp. NPDC049078 TaxID=3155767 RepID=UPI00341E33E0
MPDPTPTTSPAATRGRACRHWISDEHRHCDSTTNIRLYIAGNRCPHHTPAALAGQPEPGATAYCPPARCLCGSCPSWRPYNAYNTTADSWVTDARNIATGKKRASPTIQEAAKRTVQAQKDREQRLRKGKGSAHRLLETGSRNHTGKTLIWDTLDKRLAAHPDMIVVHGACYPDEDEHGNRPDVSADWLTHLWCLARQVPDEPHPADWPTYRRAAGPIRNGEMVAAGADECVAFPEGASTGTRDCMRQAAAAGIDVVEVTA